MRHPNRRAFICAMILFLSMLWIIEPVVGQTWLPYNGHEYALSSSLDWLDAENEAISHGGHLVAINDAAEQQFLEQQFANTANPVSPFTIWIGLFQDLNDPAYVEPGGAWKWVSGEPVPFTNWFSGEPNNSGGNEHFAVMYTTDADRPPGTWNDTLGVLNPQFGIMERIIPESTTLSLLAFTVVVALKRRR